MNLSGRLTRAEKALNPGGNGSPARIAGLIRYFKTGDAADIPQDVKAPELQEAARRTPKGPEKGFKGLGIIREALGNKLPAGLDVQTFIESNPGTIIRTYHYITGQEAPPEPGPDILARLGFSILRINVIDTIVERDGASREAGGK